MPAGAPDGASTSRRCSPLLRKRPMADGNHVTYRRHVGEKRTGAHGGDFGTWIRRRRDELGVTQEMLAERTGLAARTVRYLEAGRTRPRPSTRDVIFMALEEIARSPRHSTAAAPPPTAESNPALRPSLLPADVNGFTGRVPELAELDRFLLDASPPSAANGIVALSGTAGVGKSALAVHWAHRVRDRYPDGQIYLDLRGYSAAGAKVTSAEAARRLLHALGVAPEQIPSEWQAQIDLYRSVVSQRRMLLVFDNAVDGDHVRPLLPGGRAVGVILCSRSDLRGLIASHGVRHLRVDLLTDVDARSLLEHRLGSARVGAETAAVDDIVRGCARLPLALAIVASRAVVRPHLRLDDLAGELSRTASHLDAFSADDPAVDARSVFSWSYGALHPAAARLFRLVSQHPGPDISVPAAAGLAGLSSSEAGRLLADLCGAHMTSETAAHRYAVHDLLRSYAAERSAAEDSDSDRLDALVRLFDYYLSSAHAADRCLNPPLEPIALPSSRNTGFAERPAQPAEALKWLTAERLVLQSVVRLAADRGLDTYAWQLGLTMINFLDAHGFWHDESATAAVAVGAAKRLGDRAAEAHARRLLGFALLRLDRHEGAERELRQALHLYGSCGNAVGQAHVQYNLGQLWAGRQRPTRAISHTRRAHRIYLREGHTRGQANTSNAWGWYLAQLGRPEAAVDYCAEALTLHEQSQNLRGMANTHDSLGNIYRLLGDHDRSIAHYDHAAALTRRIGDRYYEANILEHQGRTYLASGQVVAADRVWREALLILDDLGHPHRGHLRVLLKHDMVHHPSSAANQR